MAASENTPDVYKRQQAHRAVVLKSAICITAASGVSEDTGNKKIEKMN